MPRRPLVLRHRLDPRPADLAVAAPLADSVNIPLEELPARTHELPPRDEPVRVAAAPPLAARTLRLLADLGRRGERDPDLSLAAASESATIGRLWRPNAWLEELAPRLGTGRALDLACGAGREAVYLASLGWEVVGVDVLPDALERAAALAARCREAIERVEWVLADLEGDAGFVPPRPPYDLVAGFRFLDRPLLARVADWLRPGGHLVWETFTALHRQRHGRPARDAQVLQPGELPGLIRDLVVQAFGEAWRGGAHTARVWARRLG